MTRAARSHSRMASTKYPSYVVEPPGDFELNCSFQDTSCHQFLVAGARTSGSRPPGDCGRAVPAGISSFDRGTIGSVTTSMTLAVTESARRLPLLVEPDEEEGGREAP